MRVHSTIEKAIILTRATCRHARARAFVVQADLADSRVPAFYKLYEGRTYTANIAAFEKKSFY